MRITGIILRSCYKVKNGQYRAYEHGNSGNEAWGSSDEIARKNLTEKQNPSPEKVVEDLKQYLKEIEERIDQINEFMDGDIPVTELIKARISWEGLITVKRTLESILGFPNA